MVEISELPDRELGEKFAKMRSIVRDIPVKMDQNVYPYAIRDNMTVDQFVDQQFVYRYLAVAGHHLIATEHNLERAVAPWVLGRASLEASARVAWISAVPGQIAERNYAFQLDDLPDVQDDMTNQIREKIIRKAKIQGIDKPPSELKKIIPRRQPMIEESFRMGRAYHHWSSISHANTCSVIFVSMSTDDRRISSLIAGIVWAYGIAAWNFFGSWSLPRDDLTNLLDEAGAAIGLPRSFWERPPEPV